MKSAIDRFSRLVTAPVGREALGSIGLKLANAGLVFVSSVFLARLLGPAEYGVYSYVYALITLLSVPSEFGLPTLLVRETARGIACGDYGLVKGIWVWSGGAAVFFSSVLVVGTALVITANQGLLTDKKLDVFLWGLALLPLIALGDLRGAALRGLHKIIAGQLSESLLRPGFFVLFIAACAVIDGLTFSASLAMGLYVIASALAFLGGVWLLWRATPKEVGQAAPRYESRIWFTSALPLALIGGMQIINQQIAILLQGFYLPDTEIGIFRVSTQVSLLAAVGLVAINMVLAPRFAMLYARGETSKLQRLVIGSARIILIFNLVITIGFILLGKLFLHFVFGSPYEIAYIPLLILLTGQLINSATGSVGLLLNMTGYEREVARAMMLTAVLTLILNLLFIPAWGIIGSSLATSISMITWNVLLWWTVRKKLGINSLAFNLRNRRENYS